MMERPRVKASEDPASYGAEALPAGVSEMHQVLHSDLPAGSGGAAQRPAPPLIGLITLAAHWAKKRGGA